MHVEPEATSTVDEHTDEIGDLVETDPDGAERHGDSAHREENDFTVSAGAANTAWPSSGAGNSAGVASSSDAADAPAWIAGRLEAIGLSGVVTRGGRPARCRCAAGA